MKQHIESEFTYTEDPTEAMQRDITRGLKREKRLSTKIENPKNVATRLTNLRKDNWLRDIKETAVRVPSVNPESFLVGPKVALTSWEQAAPVAGVWVWEKFRTIEDNRGNLYPSPFSAALSSVTLLVGLGVFGVSVFAPDTVFTNLDLVGITGRTAGFALSGALTAEAFLPEILAIGTGLVTGIAGTAIGAIAEVGVAGYNTVQSIARTANQLVTNTELRFTKRRDPYDVNTRRR